MAFGSKGASDDKGAGRGGGEGALTIVAAGTVVQGELRSNGVVKIEGEVVGTVRAARQVLVARGGKVDGDVFTAEAIVGGEVDGSVVADDRVEIQTGSVVHGDITTQRLSVQEGGEVNGQVNMGAPSGDGRAAPSPEAPSNSLSLERQAAR